MHDGSVEAFVGNQQVGAAAHNETGSPAASLRQNCFDNFCFGGGADVGLSRAAYLGGGGQFAQQLFSHRLRIPVVVRGQHPPYVKVTKPYGDFAFIFRRLPPKEAPPPAGEHTQASAQPGSHPSPAHTASGSARAFTRMLLCNLLLHRCFHTYLQAHKLYAETNHS